VDILVESKALGWWHSQNNGPWMRWLLNVALHFGNVPPPMGFTYHKAWGKIYHESNLRRSWGIRVGGILCLLLNTRREIYGYKVPSKCSTDFLQVLYETKMHVKNWNASSSGHFFFSKHSPLIIIFLVISNGYHGEKWITQLANLFDAFKMPSSCFFFWVISSEYDGEKTNRNFWPFFMLDNASLQKDYSTQSAPKK
jgi:hypothetical protein